MVFREIGGGETVFFHLSYIYIFKPKRLKQPDDSIYAIGLDG